MIGDSPAEVWLRAQPTLPPRKRRRRTVWAILGAWAAIEVLIGVFVP